MSDYDNKLFGLNIRKKNLVKYKVSEKNSRD